jgi:acetyl esterase/lipase
VKHGFATVATIIGVFCWQPEGVTKEPGGMPMTHLSVGSTLGEVLQHPAFAGFARRILPWDDKAYDEELRLRDIGSLLPFHSHVAPDLAVSTLNRMIDDAAAGRTVFYDFYTAADKQRDPTKRNAGLFFFRGKPGAPFSVIAPGGGFPMWAPSTRVFPTRAISRRGYNAFVVKYRAGYGGEVATADLAAAIAYIFRHSASLEVSTAGYSLWGSSAGARMAAAIGSHGTARYGGPELPKPAAVVMAYTAHMDLAADEPPTFVAVGERDGIAPPSTMRRRVNALRSAGTEVEYHEYRGLGHGFGLGVGTSAEGWVLQAVQFWARQVERPGIVDARVKCSAACSRR